MKYPKKSLESWLSKLNELFAKLQTSQRFNNNTTTVRAKNMTACLIRHLKNFLDKAPHWNLETKDQ